MHTESGMVPAIPYIAAESAIVNESITTCNLRSPTPHHHHQQQQKRDSSYDNKFTTLTFIGE